FSTFFDRVVDPQWLNLSHDPRAAALREARGESDQQPWRVLHRVTYVSRIPPEYEIAPKQGGESVRDVPANIPASGLLLDLIPHRLQMLRMENHYSPAQIGKAVKMVMDNDLANFLPRWKAFLEEASIPNSPE